MKEKIKNFLEYKYVKDFLIILIIFNILMFIFETDNTLFTHFHILFKHLELFSIIVFSIEYFLRAITINNFKDLVKPLMIIDLLAILPFYLSIMSINTVYLRVLRLFRLIRIAKLTRYTRAFTNIKRTFTLKRIELLITSLMYICALTIFSILIYYAENSTGHKTFSSIPSSYWWAIVTFTTVGYSDAGPVTTFGKFITGVAAIIGVCFNGLFLGIISSSFMDAIEHKKRIKERKRDLRKRKKFRFWKATTPKI